MDPERIAQLFHATARDRQAALVILALAAAVLALAELRYGFTWEEVTREGVDIVVALDVSDSMLVEDVEIVAVSAENGKKLVVASAEKTSRLIVVHEDNHTCGLGAEVLATVAGDSGVLSVRQSVFVKIPDTVEATVRSNGSSSEDDWILNSRYQFDLALMRNPFIYQISRDIGVRFTKKTITTHKIDPNVDETREFLLENLAYAQALKKVGYLKGVGAVPMDQPKNALAMRMTVTGPTCST